MRAGLVVALLALASAAPAHAGTVVKAAQNAKLNATILVDARGDTLYLFTEDTKQRSYCVNDGAFHCSKHWLPLRTSGAPKAGPGARQALLGTIKRDDGTTQVTYRGHPLYTFHGGYGLPGDKPGDVNGQDYVQIWYAVSPAGKAIEKPKPLRRVTASGTVVKAMQSTKLGATILVDPNGMTSTTSTRTSGP